MFKGKVNVESIIVRMFNPNTRTLPYDYLQDSSSDILS
jgi:hypothetical protein